MKSLTSLGTFALTVLLATGCSDVGGPELTPGTPVSGDAASLSEIQKLLPGDGGDGHWFGRSVSLDGDVMIVGARFDESAYLFQASGGTWTEVAKLVPPSGEAGHQFGYSVDVDGSVAVVGEMWDDEKGSNSGSAYVFEHTDGTWSRTAKLTSADLAAGDRFGGDVAVDGDVALVGAWADDDQGSDSGSTYVFEKSDGVWSQTAKLTADDGATNDRFGGDVAVDGNLAVIAAGGDGLHEGLGAAYVFDGESGWSQVAKLAASDGGSKAYFGSDVAVSGGVVLVGAMWDDDLGTASGSAYVFDLGSP